MLRGSLTCVSVTTPAEVEVRLVFGPPNRAEFVALNASARNCRFQPSCRVKALNIDRSALGAMGGRRVGNVPLSTRSVLLPCWMKAGCKVCPLRVQFVVRPVVRIVQVLKNFELLPPGNEGSIPVERKPPGAASGKPFSRMNTPLSDQPFRNTPRIPPVWLKMGSVQLPLITMRLGVSWPASVRSGVCVMGSWAFSHPVAFSHLARV